MSATEIAAALILGWLSVEFVLALVQLLRRRHRDVAEKFEDRR